MNLQSLFPSRSFDTFGLTKYAPVSEPHQPTVLTGQRKTLNHQVKELCPLKPGVYEMLNPHGELIYVGKAKSLRLRLMGYFRPKSRDPKAGRILRQAATILWEDQPSEFAAHLRELELIARERRMIERRIKAAKFPTVKSLDSFDFTALPSLNKALVMELARSEYVERRENIIAVGNSGTGKSHIAVGLGLAACQKGLSVSFTTAAALVHELIEARDEKRLLRLQRQLAGHKLLIVDELGYVPLSQTGAELLFEVFSQRYERSATIVTSNLPFDEWTSVFGSERLTGALLDRDRKSTRLNSSHRT